MVNNAFTNTIAFALNRTSDEFKDDDMIFAEEHE